MKFILATGGSGGHIIPAVKVAQVLWEEGHDVLFAGALGRYRESVRAQGFVVQDIPVQGLKGKSFFSLIGFMGCNAKGFVRSVRLLKEYGPHAVVGFGGYGSFPTVLAAVALRYPSAIHEQNVILGKANQILSRWVRKVFVSFSVSRKNFDSAKTILTGCPCQRKASRLQDDLYSAFGFDSQKKTILVFGGSQGSHRLNDIFVQTVERWPDKAGCQVIHVSGEKDYLFVKEAYAREKINAAVFSYCEEMGRAYGVADVIIARAGALTVAEIAQARIPAILVPYPHAGGHQKANAAVLSDSGLAQVIEEKDLSVGSLTAAVEERLRFSAEREKFDLRVRPNLAAAFPVDAADKLKKEITTLAA